MRLTKCSEIILQVRNDFLPGSGQYFCRCFLQLYAIWCKHCKGLIMPDH